MTKGQRTVVSLLAVVAVLLGLNLIVGGSTPAAAQAQGMGRPANVLDFTVLTDGFGFVTAFRLWSDGTIEGNRGISPPCCIELCLPMEWCGWQDVPEVRLISP